MTSILLRNISISRSYQDLATRTGMRAGQKRYARKQAEYKREYLHSKERNGRFFRQACIMQENIRRGQTTVWKINKTQDREEKLTYALQALELILCDEGLAKHNGVNLPEYAGCEYCNGVTEWSEKLGADGKEVRFEFCPVCGRMIEEG